MLSVQHWINMLYQVQRITPYIGPLTFHTKIKWWWQNQDLLSILLKDWFLDWPLWTLKTREKLAPNCVPKFHISFRINANHQVLHYFLSTFDCIRRVPFNDDSSCTVVEHLQCLAMAKSFVLLGSFKLGGPEKENCLSFFISQCTSDPSLTFEMMYYLIVFEFVLCFQQIITFLRLLDSLILDDRHLLCINHFNSLCLLIH